MGNIQGVFALALSLFYSLSSAHAETDPLAPAFADLRSAAIHFLQPIFYTLDCEKVGVVEAGEVEEHFYEIFFRADRDHSRSISRQEFRLAAVTRNDRKEDYIFDLMNRDGNDVVSVQEFLQHVYTAIDLADSNKNGELTEQEAGIIPARQP